MFFVNVTLLRQQLPELEVEEYVQAVDAAWTDVAADVRGLGSRPMMSLQLQDPSRDPRTVTVTVGMSVYYGATSAKSPAELRKALVQLLRDRFVPTSPSVPDTQVVPEE